MTTASIPTRRCRTRSRHERGTGHGALGGRCARRRVRTPAAAPAIPSGNPPARVAVAHAGAVVRLRPSRSSVRPTQLSAGGPAAVNPRRPRLHHNRNLPAPTTSHPPAGFRSACSPTPPSRPEEGLPDHTHPHRVLDPVLHRRPPIEPANRGLIQTERVRRHVLRVVLGRQPPLLERRQVAATRPIPPNTDRGKEVQPDAQRTRITTTRVHRQAPNLGIPPERIHQRIGAAGRIQKDRSPILAPLRSASSRTSPTPGTRSSTGANCRRKS